MTQNTSFETPQSDDDVKPVAHQETFERIKTAVLDGDAEQAMSLVKEALADGITPDDIVENALIASMSAVGRDFKSGDFYIPDVLMSSRASHAALFVLQSAPTAHALTKDRGTVVVGTVAGDLHDIGKNIASLMLQCEHFDVIDLGIDVVPEVFVEAIREHQPIVVGLSALLTTTIGEMRKVIEAVECAGLRDSVKIYVSGLPVTREYASEIGADHYCEDARDTVEYVESLVAETGDTV